LNNEYLNHLFFNGLILLLHQILQGFLNIVHNTGKYGDLIFLFAMKFFKKFLLSSLTLVFIGYFFILGWFYLNQESLIFNPSPLPDSYRFSFDASFSEVTVPAADGAQLHGLLFESDSAYGLVFYLHGNRGALNRWGDRAGLYLDSGFDVFMMDYRSYGKSTGIITSETQFLDDVERAFLHVNDRYADKPIVIVGYSLGSGPASYLAKKYHPEMLILMAPYYSIPDLASSLYPFLPPSLSKYEFANHRYLREVPSKTVIFQGEQDQLIDINASVRLRSSFKARDTLIVLQDQGHSGIHRNRIYREEMNRLLASIANIE